MNISDETVQKVQKFVENRQEAERESKEEPLSGTALHVYTQRLDATLQQLQEQLRQLNSLDLSETGTDIRSRISQARRAKKAYDSLLKTSDELPAINSALPSLLAIEETTRIIQESKISIRVTAEELSVDRERLRFEEANLRDSESIASGLRERIQRIRDANARKEEQTPKQVAREQVSARKKRNKELDRTTSKLKVSLDKFIDETLAPMLAAEDLGGPTVGDEFEVSDATLKAGYTTHGKPKKQKEPAEVEGGSQQRLDKFMRRNDDSSPVNKREAAAKEMHDLLNVMLETNSYIDLKRDSAASRFLVRAKVAQFHPRDARRLRLIDFGRSLGN
ncbi:hypothetical protein N7461_004862 [Penicillium sp. DV-2018c]|nr:hypothetical protein N7461_004862 [Penicillium sp. DV-2018c]